MTLITTIATEDGRRFPAEVSNLTPRSMFIRTAQPLAFRERLRLTLLGSTVPGVVIFAAQNPRGVVLLLEPDKALQSKIEHGMRQAEVAPPPPLDADAWKEITNTDVTADLEASGDLDSSSDLEAPWADGTSLVPNDPAGANPADPSADRLPSLRTHDLDPRPAVSSHAAPRREATPTPAPVLPVLERDGCTVRFQDYAAFVEQYASHLVHGGLVVAADPMTVGTQRMLVLAIPDKGDYTVSARVVFNQPGVVGFMVDSFGLHRERLKALADR